MTSIGTKIRNARKEAGMTQVELAKKTSLSRSYIGDIEKDRYNPSVATLRAIAEATGVPVESILGNSTSTQPPAQKEDREHKHLQDLLSDPHLRRILESSGQLSESSLQEVQNFIDFQLGKKKQ